MRLGRPLPIADPPAPPAGARELQHKANNLLRRLNLEVFNDGVEVEKLAHAIGLIEDFANDVLTQERARADKAERYGKVQYGIEQVLKQDIQSLHAEVESLRKELAQANVALEASRKLNQMREAELGEMQDALTRYGTHRSECLIKTSEKRCDCGFEALLSRIDKSSVADGADAEGGK